MSADTGYPPIACGLVLIGAGSGMFMPANTTALLDGVSSRRIGIVNAMRLMVQNTGVVVSTALAMSLVTSPLPAGLRQYVFAGTIADVSSHGVAQLVTGYRLALLVMTVISALSVIASLGQHRATGVTTGGNRPSEEPVGKAP